MNTKEKRKTNRWLWSLLLLVLLIVGISCSNDENKYESEYLKFLSSSSKLSFFD